MQLRWGVAADAEDVLAIYAPIVESTAITFELEVPTAEEMGARIVARQPRLPWLVGHDQRGLLGYAYAGAFHPRAAYDWSVETSVYVHERARGQGVGRRLYEVLLATLAEQGYRQAMALIALPNAASVALHGSAGFLPVGVHPAAGWKLGAWHDVGWWQRPLTTGAGPPEPLRPIRPAPAG